MNNVISGALKLDMNHPERIKSMIDKIKEEKHGKEY
jgi:hypothetical protein